MPAAPKGTKSKNRSAKPRSTRQIKVWRHNHVIALLLLISFSISIFISASLYFLVSLHIPDLQSLASYKPAATTVIYDRHGNTLSLVYKENRRIVSLKQMPKLLPKAFIAAEDARFFHHQGVDGWSILRALVHNMKAGSRGQGGSTITQQVAKALLLTPEKTYTRKFKEAILAYRIDKALSKQDILYIYLNHIYLGEGAYGVGAAAYTYFGKPVNELNLAEIAILAGLPQAPSRYSPFKHFKKAKHRQAYVLNRLAEDAYITPEAARKAYKQALLWQPQSDGTDEETLYFVQHVKNYISSKYGYKALNTGGLKIYTTLDRNLQKSAAKAIRQGVAQWGIRQQASKSNHPQAALISLEVKTGKIRAMMGGVNFLSSQFNRATQAKRQPGSAFKPLVYAAALAKGRTPNTMITDEPVVFTDTTGKSWEPRNFSGTFKGPTTLRNGLVYSNNIVTIKLLREISIPTVIDLSRRMGIASSLTPNLSLALGSSEMSLQELTSAYTVFANAGKHTPPLFINRIEDRTNNIIEQNKPTPHQVLAPQTAFQVSYILQGVITEGTGKQARGIPYSAGKTGTTDNYIDAWFIGYTPTLATGVWMGHDRYKSLGKGETGGRAAAPIWRNFMQNAGNYRAKHDFKTPNGITFIPIDKQTGEFEYLNTDKALWEAFRKDNLPSWKKRLREEER